MDTVECIVCGRMFLIPVVVGISSLQCLAVKAEQMICSDECLAVYKETWNNTLNHCCRCTNFVRNPFAWINGKPLCEDCLYEKDI